MYTQRLNGLHLHRAGDAVTVCELKDSGVRGGSYSWTHLLQLELNRQ